MYFVFVQVQNIFRSQLFISSNFLQYLSKCNLIILTDPLS